ncbi:MAG: cellulose-binding protein [Sulfobacillus acidophilus]|uniref:Cellulose-binding protein n=1 Tax=Sulfobacillus acidophilus TaxID=53633 RepID=A0A2T2WCX8_9FIRM|nr:MAG: cellulose-binding protein [Sulfobacillus acidophilus]
MLVAVALIPLASGEVALPPPAVITVNAAHSMGIIPATAFGLNTEVWDKDLTSPAIPALLRRIGVGVLRYPGGSIADQYDWANNRLVPGQSGYVDPRNTFARFMQLVRQVGATALITVNYGSNFSGTGGGEPQEAAAWVRDADVTHHDQVRYWEIGNEVYGNGTYGVTWELDLHRHKGPAVYAENARRYIAAMKQADPHIQVGVVLTLPENWPWGLAPHWNRTVLRIVGRRVNFVAVHWYPQNPGHTSNAGLLASTRRIPAMMAILRREIEQGTGDRAAHIEVFVDETNSVSSDPGAQTTSIVNALFLDNDFMSWLEYGAANVSWWDLHNGANVSQDTKGGHRSEYGDYGLLSNGSRVQNVQEPPAETPFPTYYAYQMLRILARPGDTMIQAHSSQPLVDVYAVHQSNGDLGVMLVNTAASQAYRIRLHLSAYQAAKVVHGHRYDAHTHRVRTQRVALNSPITIPPYSVTVFILHPNNPPKHERETRFEPLSCRIAARRRSMMRRSLGDHVERL